MADNSSYSPSAQGLQRIDTLLHAQTAAGTGTKRKRVSQREIKIKIGLNSEEIPPSEPLAKKTHIFAKPCHNTGSSVTSEKYLDSTVDNVLSANTEKPVTNVIKRNRVSKRQAQIYGIQAVNETTVITVSESQPLGPELLQHIVQESRTSADQPESSGVKRKRGLKKQTCNLGKDIFGSDASPTMNKRRTRPKSRRTTRIPAATIRGSLPAGPHILPDVESCQKCGARKILYESKKFCCGDGTVVLPINTYPPQLIYLYTSSDERAVHFQKYARLYNNVFAYSSIGGTIDAQTVKGIYVFKLQGQFYHYVPDLLPTDGSPRYLQLYFYDGQHEAQRRAGCLPELRRDVVDILMEITSLNLYAKFFRSLREIDVQENTQIVINKNARIDQRVYNAPTSDEVAVIWSEQSATGETSGPHITVTGKTQTSHRILHFYGCYDPLQYPLLFPYGESGWHQGLKKIENGSIAPFVESTLSATSFIDVEDLLEEESNREYLFLLVFAFILEGWI